MKPVFVTPFTYERSKPAQSGKPSQTQPNMAMTVREIFLRHASGQPIPVNRDLVYGGATYYPDPETLDLVEREALFNEATERVKLLEERYASEKSEAVKAVQQKELDKWKELAEKFQKSPDGAPPEARTA